MPNRPPMLSLRLMSFLMPSATQGLFVRPNQTSTAASRRNGGGGLRCQVAVVTPTLPRDMMQNWSLCTIRWCGMRHARDYRWMIVACGMRPTCRRRRKSVSVFYLSFVFTAMGRRARSAQPLLRWVMITI